MDSVDFARGFLAELALKGMKNKPEVLAELMKGIKASLQDAEKLPDILGSALSHDALDELEPIEAARCIRLLVKIQARQSKALMQAYALLMIFVMSDEFDRSAGSVAIKGGRGHEALREMVRNKFGSR